ncbi:uncharacterized protein LOC123545146 [Mercenaria mercenaria]|uniref:uncharacterized protein LOC123545146 n=1 Tax=Mercenaria mercenaria TaxID=6596 RepID=UPI00234E5906|nr:uncharacterized protein LOC123545146 [Mercenaria mercenaria]
MGKGEHEEPHVYSSVYIVGDVDKGNTFVNTELPQNKVGPEPMEGARDFCAEEEPVSADHAEALKRLKERREREPLFYCKIVTRWPLQSFLITLFAHILMILISAALVASGYDLLPVDFENLPLEINDQHWRPRDLAWTYRDDFDTYYDRTPVTGYRVKSYLRANIDLYYDAGGDNVFTKERLKKIQSIENSLVSVGEYQNNYCQFDSNLTGCQSPMSVIRYFDGTYSSIDSVFNDPNFDNIAAVLYEAYTNNATKADFQFFLGKSNEITSTRAYSSITRSVIPLGYPLQGYAEDEDYEKVMRTFSVNHMKPTLVSVRENCDLFDFSYRSDMLWLEDVFTQAMKDVFCAFGSICFIFCLILIHTRSLWITGLAIFSIISCFVITNLIYRIVLDFRYIGFFHVLTLFIVLGIGADDIFVFYDVWRNTAYESYPSLAHRLSDSYRKSVFSMLFTSITTSVAFFASAISPLLATRSFGVFSGLVIIVNYLSVILYFPTVVIMYHTKFEKFKWPCIAFCNRKCRKNCACCKSENQNTIPDKRRRDTVSNSKFSDKNGAVFKTDAPNGLYPKEINRDKEESVQVSIRENRQSFTTQISINNPGTDSTTVMNGKSAKANGFVNDAFESDTYRDVYIPEEKNAKESNDIEEKKTVPKMRKEKSFMVRFFRDKYSKFITHKVMRWVILAVMATVLIIFTVQASKLEPDNEGLQVLKDSHVYSIAEDHSVNSFVLSNADRTLILHIVWGMHPNDMSDCHFSTPQCRGKKDWDTSFDPNTPEAQTAVQNMCSTMFNWSPGEASQYRVRTDIITGEYQISCYIHNLDQFLEEESASTGTDWNLTYDYTKTLAFMNDRSTYYDTSGFTSDYKHYLEVPISYWLSNKYSYNYTEDFYLFDELIGEMTGDYSTALKTDNTRKYGNDIRYIGIQVNTTIKVRTLGYAEGIPIMNKWEDFVNAEMTKMPVGMKNGFQTTRYIWHWLIVSEMLAKNAMYGIIIGVSLALPILIIATRNIITGCLATFSMCCSTVCVIGVIPLGGWKLGVLESLNMCMVVGLTVDYVVHLAEGYTLSLHKDRFSRVRDMLDEMAVSVFFGAITTLGASMFMFIAQLSFFLQFGIFMFSTIGFSLFFAMGMFVTLMGLCGPQGDTGNLVALFQRLHKWCKSKRGEGLPPSESRAQLAPGNMPSSGSRASLASGYLPSINSRAELNPT